MVYRIVIAKIIKILIFWGLVESKIHMAINCNCPRDGQGTEYSFAAPMYVLSHITPKQRMENLQSTDFWFAEE